eukprot:Skav200641  [mRNA]  locus=scaffold353:240704:248271:+ [translate_table: standard]
MGRVAMLVKELLNVGHVSEKSGLVVCATHFISCLFKRWAFVTMTTRVARRFFHFGTRGRQQLPYVCLLEMAIVVSGRLRTELPLRDYDDTARCILENIFRPLLQQVHHFASADLQDVLDLGVATQVKYGWQFDAVAKCLWDISTELSSSKWLEASPSKHDFLRAIRLLELAGTDSAIPMLLPLAAIGVRWSQEAVANALRAAYAKYPDAIQRMLPSLARNTWMMLDMRCTLCIDLANLWMHQGPTMSARKLEPKHCEEMLHAYCKASQFSELLPILCTENLGCRTCEHSVVVAQWEWRFESCG